MNDNLPFSHALRFAAPAPERKPLLTHILILSAGLRANLGYFKVPQTGIENIRLKQAMKIHDEYANILRCVYSVRFNGSPSDQDASKKTRSDPTDPRTPLWVFQALGLQIRPVQFRSRYDNRSPRNPHLQWNWPHIHHKGRN